MVDVFLLMLKLAKTSERVSVKQHMNLAMAKLPSTKTAIQMWLLVSI